MTSPFHPAHSYFFHFVLSVEEESIFKAYVEVFPVYYWRRNINIYEDKKSKLYKITDGIQCHEIYKHEFTKN